MINTRAALALSAALAGSGCLCSEGFPWDSRFAGPRSGPLPAQPRPQAILAPRDVSDVHGQGRFLKDVSHQGEPLVEDLFDFLLVRLLRIDQQGVGTALDLRPAQPQFQKGDALADGRWWGELQSLFCAQ